MNSHYVAQALKYILLGVRNDPAYYRPSALVNTIGQNLHGLSIGRAGGGSSSNSAQSGSGSGGEGDRMDIIVDNTSNEAGLGEPESKVMYRSFLYLWRYFIVLLLSDLPL